MRVFAVSGLAVGDRAEWARFDSGQGDSVRTRPAPFAWASCAGEAAETSAALRLGSPSGRVSQGVRGGDRLARAKCVGAGSCFRVARAEHESARAHEDEPVLRRVAWAEHDSARAYEDDADINGSIEEAVTCTRSRGYGFLRIGGCSLSALLLRPSRSSLKGLRPIPSVRAQSRMRRWAGGRRLSIASRF